MQANASSCAEVVVASSSWARLTPSPGVAVGKPGAIAMLGGFVANRVGRAISPIAMKIAITTPAKIDGDNQAM